MTEIYSRIGNESKMPTEILDRIFGFLERSRRRSVQSAFLPKSCLCPLLSVCKRWQSIAERRLYMYVYLGCDRTARDKDGNDVVKKTGREISELFCETVQNNPRLASLVRELELSGPDKLEDSRIRIDIIRGCRKVARLSIVSFHSDHVDDLKAALAETDLISLDLMDLPRLTDRTSRCFSLPMLFDLLPKWPRIESVSAKLGKGDMWKRFGLGAHDDEDNAEFTQAGTCPSLRTIHLEADNFEPSLLSVVGDMTPNIEDVSIVLQNNRSNAALHRCLQIWSPSLTKLAVHTSLFGTRLLYDRCPIIDSPLSQLRFLDMNAPLFLPSAARFLPALEVLYFEGEYSHGWELVGLLHDREVMPCLNKLHVSFSWAEGDDCDSHEEKTYEILDALQEACRDRGVLVRHQYMFMVSSESEGSNDDEDDEEEEKEETEEVEVTGPFDDD